jgi:hypothetical protein
MDAAGYPAWPWDGSKPCPRAYQICNHRIREDKRGRTDYDAVHKCGCDSNDCWACFPRNQIKWATESARALANHAGDDEPLHHARLSGAPNSTALRWTGCP